MRCMYRPEFLPTYQDHISLYHSLPFSKVSSPRLTFSSLRWSPSTRLPRQILANDALRRAQALRIGWRRHGAIWVPYGSTGSRVLCFCVDSIHHPLCIGQCWTVCPFDHLWPSLTIDFFDQCAPWGVGSAICTAACGAPNWVRTWAQEGLLVRDDFGAVECDGSHTMNRRGKKQDNLPVLGG